MKIQLALFFTLIFGCDICMPVAAAKEQEQHIIKKSKKKTKKEKGVEIRRRIQAKKREIKIGITVMFLILMVYGSHKKRNQQNIIQSQQNITRSQQNITQFQQNITQSRQNSDPNIIQSNPNPVQDGTSTSNQQKNSNADNGNTAHMDPVLNPDHTDESAWLTDQNQTFPDSIIQKVQQLVEKEKLKDWKNWVVTKRDYDIGKLLIEFLNKQGIKLSSSRKEKTYIYMVAYEKLIKHSTEYSPLAMAYILTQLSVVLVQALKDPVRAQSLIKGNSVENLLGKAILHHQESHTTNDELLQQQNKANLIPLMHVIINHGQFKEATSEEGTNENKYDFKMEEVELDKTHFGYDSVHELAKAKGVNIDDIASDEIGDLQFN